MSENVKCYECDGLGYVSFTECNVTCPVCLGGARDRRSRGEVA
jgi:hypothetical protein